MSQNSRFGNHTNSVALSKYRARCAISVPVNQLVYRRIVAIFPAFRIKAVRIVNVHRNRVKAGGVFLYRHSGNRSGHLSGLPRVKVLRHDKMPLLKTIQIDLSMGKESDQGNCLTYGMALKYLPSR